MLSFLICLVLSLTCLVPALSAFAEEPDLSDWDAVVEAARGSRVTFYGWGGYEYRNRWLSETVAPWLKEHYDITLDPVGMNIDDILAKLSGEKQAGSRTGTIDMIWINGENFYSARDNGLLYGHQRGYGGCFRLYR